MGGYGDGDGDDDGDDGGGGGGDETLCHAMRVYACARDVETRVALAFLVD